MNTPIVKAMYRISKLLCRTSFSELGRNLVKSVDFSGTNFNFGALEFMGEDKIYCLNDYFYFFDNRRKEYYQKNCGNFYFYILITDNKEFETADEIYIDFKSKKNYYVHIWVENNAGEYIVGDF